MDSAFLSGLAGILAAAAPILFAAIGETLTERAGVTNLSVNPARSTGPAIFVGGWALAQLWLFWIAPIAGAAVAGIVHRQVFSVPDEK